MTAFHQHHAPIFNDDGAHADQRNFGEFALHDFAKTAQGFYPMPNFTEFFTPKDHSHGIYPVFPRALCV